FTTYAIEVLPAFKQYSGQYQFPDTNAGGSWRTTDPVAEKNSLVASNRDSGGKTTHLVKLAKAWRRYRGAQIKSFILELVSVEFVRQWSYNTSGGTYTGVAYYDFMMRDFLPFLLGKKNTYLLTPGTYDLVATGSAWEAQARFAASAAARATQYGSEDKL